MRLGLHQTVRRAGRDLQIKKARPRQSLRPSPSGGKFHGVFGPTAKQYPEIEAAPTIVLNLARIDVEIWTV